MTENSSLRGKCWLRQIARKRKETQETQKQSLVLLVPHLKQLKSAALNLPDDSAAGWTPLIFEGVSVRSQHVLSGAKLEVLPEFEAETHSQMVELR
jgi:hypothetical protein